jgi:hypothetical protein
MELSPVVAIVLGGIVYGATVPIALGQANSPAHSDRYPLAIKSEMARRNLPAADRIRRTCQTYGTAPDVNPASEALNYTVKRKGEFWQETLKGVVPVHVRLVEPPLHGTYKVIQYFPGELGAREVSLRSDGMNLYKYVPLSPELAKEDRWSFLVDLSNGKNVLVRFQMSPGHHDLGDTCQTSLLK